MSQTEIKIFTALSIIIGAGVWLVLFAFKNFDRRAMLPHEILGLLSP